MRWEAAWLCGYNAAAPIKPHNVKGSSVKKRALGCLVLSLSLLVCFGIAEAFLRIASSRWLRVFDVEMWQYARQVKIESDHPGVVEEHRPNAEAFLMGATVRTDEHGYRRADDATEAERRPDDRQVIALGDSVTFAWGVAEGQTFPDQLERLLNRTCPAQGGRRTTVKNAGIGNCNTAMEVARYRELIRARRPEWLILGYSYNDAEPDPVPSKNFFYWNSSLLSLGSARLARLGPYRDYKSYYLGLYEEGKPAWIATQKAIRDLGAMLREDGIPGTVILLPELHEPRNFGPFAGLFASVRKVALESGFEVIDPSHRFPEGSGEKFWVSHEDAHPTAEAQGFYAEELAKSAFACR